MAYSPLISGGVVVEVPKSEYEKLVQKAERVDVVERLVAANEYVSTKDIVAILGIEIKKQATVADHKDEKPVGE